MYTSTRRGVITAISALAATVMFALGTGNALAQTAKGKVLIVLSAADKWTRADGSKYDSGVWAEEFIVMDEKMVKAGFEVDIATPGGVKPTMDPRSMDAKVVGDDNLKHFRTYMKSIEGRLAKPLTLAKVDIAQYKAVMIPGGHGPVEDLYKDPDMGRLLIAANRASKVIAPVCHGQAALLAAKDASGKWEFAGRKMTSFSDEEEIEFGTASNAPWLLASTLRKNGAIYSKGPNWGAYIVKDGNLISGQNPASTAPVTEAVIEALR